MAEEDQPDKPALHSVESPRARRGLLSAAEEAAVARQARLDRLRANPFEGLESVKPPKGLKNTDSDDTKYQAERRQLELDQARARTRHANSEAADHEQLVQQRREFAKKFVWIAVGWLIFVGLAVGASGTSYMPFQLSDSILKWLLGTATANVMGPAYFLAKYLFGKPR